METRIAKIILWPNDERKRYRSIDFQKGSVNVVTGWSQTGKSALIPIVDYCLGSGKCAIPVGVIRQKTAWFGVLLEIQGRQLLLARREPGEQQGTAEMLMDEGGDIVVPPHPEPNCSVDAVKSRLNQLAMLPSLDFNEGGTRSAFHERPSFRDMMAFVFQAQHIVANPYTLFYKADTTEHREKLRTILPFVLGSIDSRHLALRHQLVELEHELDRKKRQLENVRRAASIWLSELASQYHEAREYGLLPTGLSPSQDWRAANYIACLKDVPTRAIHHFEPRLDDENTAQAVATLTRLGEDEESIAEQIQSVRSKLAKIERLRNSTESYRDALQTQNRRLEAVGWLSERLQGITTCPLCGNPNHGAQSEIEQLKSAVRAVEETSAAVTLVPNVFDKELLDLKKHLRRLEEHLNSIRTQRSALEAKSAVSQQARQTYHNILRFVGRLEQSLSNYSVAQEDSGLSEEILSLTEQVVAIREELDPERARARLDNALRRVDSYAQGYIRTLGVERPNDPVEFDVSNLSVRVSSATGRRDFLWEIGSGSNWLGYHIALLLGLHRHFLSQPSSPVPSILILDQPSQIYFPDKWPTDPASKQTNALGGLQNGYSEEEAYRQGSLRTRNDDIEGVKRIFETLATAVADAAGALQIIVIDHADTPTWDGVGNVHVAARWRDGSDKLVPPDWITDNSQDQ